MKKQVLIVAGGKGLRMGGDLPKQFIPLKGKPILMHTLEAFHRWDESAELVLVLPEDHQPYWQMLCREIGCHVPHRIATGGETRFHSVRNGLELIRKENNSSSGQALPGLIAVHDGVRPFVSAQVIDACFAAAAQCGSAIPVVPMIDSLRKQDADGNHPVDRAHYFAVQTPQVFRAELLQKAYSQTYSPLFTDDASVVEAMGEKVQMVAGSRENIKITTPMDILLGDAFLSQHKE